MKLYFGVLICLQISNSDKFINSGRIDVKEIGLFQRVEKGPISMLTERAYFQQEGKVEANKKKSRQGVNFEAKFLNTL